ncbi:uncharacterized membrane protein (DUF4010 family) [Tahibacter aquaticus]|uniref:Uncharacterized membrane protein (DUF4010 family) n=1 Tax=Tahibacter aquaticus TaxID=520092 RepID=A0A4R6Z0A9_9GAMM|nr:DUF4010 domain-containing protein [Tahibacter aquaticus]TDR44945.1 uncharacterized membrane protein (DUF4010 family) [Tahibacter aquaticus]
MDPVGAQQLFGLIAAIGGGLLVGVGREREKARQPEHEPAGVRSFSVVALAGAVAMLLGPVALAVAGAAVLALAAASYWHSVEHDPGVTTELALLVTFLLGALAQRQPQLAAGLFVALAVLLQSKSALHRFTRQVLSEQELNDALLLAASALIVLPLLPDRAVDPWDVLNPRKLWLFVVLVMSINALGYIALRLLGSGRGLVLAGLLGGFVSSAATIAGMGQRAAADPRLLHGCVAAALLSCVATVVQLTAILLAIAPALLQRLLVPLAAAGIAAVAIAAWFVWRGRTAQAGGEQTLAGRPFALRQALLFAAVIAGALLLSTALQHFIGEGGVLAAAAAAGLADVHAAAISLGQLVGSGNVAAHEAAWALAAAFTTNSLVKCFGASVGGAAFARPVVAGVLAINASLVLAVALQPA